MRTVIVSLIITIFTVYSTRAQNSSGHCQTSCGAKSSVQYPFGFSGSCPIQLNCSNNSEIRIGEFRVQNVTSDRIFVDFPPICDRTIQSISPLFSDKFAPTSRNGLLLRNCTAYQNDCVVSITTSFFRYPFNLSSCDSRSDNISCIAAKGGESAEFLSYKSVIAAKCQLFFSSIVVDSGLDESAVSLIPQRVELGWWLEGDCNCSADSFCVQVYKTNGNKGFRCRCKEGFLGDGFVGAGSEGCRKVSHCNRSRYLSGKCGGIGVLIGGISSGLGLLVLFVGGWWFYKVVKLRRKQKNKFFKRNGGLLLQQQLSHEINVENIKLFNSKDLEKATDSFNVNRILGQGGQGTVYKGMLVDGRIVAVKKSKVIDEEKLGEFINEVVILSKINHRNVVQLIGCCLETEVPLLVYEYVPNGTLFHYVNGQIEEFPLTWNMRLRIAREVAGALFYLHSAASTPIYHRDIKSTNILLDDKYRAKVADFGTSRSINIDQTHLTTLVHGTFGYLDPEYFQSSKFTEKSDVYSFGVVLAELLTGKKAIFSTRTQESKSLATYFIQSVEENNLFDIIDSRVLKEGKIEQIIATANLTKRCLNLNGKKRPTMKEVAMELESVQMLQKPHKLQQNYEEPEYVLKEMYKPWDGVATSAMSSSSLDGQPSLSFQSI